MRKCIYTLAGIIRLLRYLRSRLNGRGQGASPLKPTTPAKSLTVTSTPAAAELTDEAPGARTPVCMLCYTTSDVQQMHTIGCAHTCTRSGAHTRRRTCTYTCTHTNAQTGAARGQGERGSPQAALPHLAARRRGAGVHAPTHVHAHPCTCTRTSICTCTCARARVQ